MIPDRSTPSTFARNSRRAVIIRQYRLMLEAEVRRLRMFPEDDEQQVFEFEDGGAAR